MCFRYEAEHVVPHHKVTANIQSDVTPSYYMQYVVVQWPDCLLNMT